MMMHEPYHASIYIYMKVTHQMKKDGFFPFLLLQSTLELKVSCHRNTMSLLQLDLDAMGCVIVPRLSYHHHSSPIVSSLVDLVQLTTLRYCSSSCCQSNRVTFVTVNNSVQRFLFVAPQIFFYLLILQTSVYSVYLLIFHTSKQDCFYFPLSLQLFPPVFFHINTLIPTKRRQNDESQVLNILLYFNFNPLHNSVWSQFM